MAKDLRAFGAYMRRLRKQKGISRSSLVLALQGRVGLRTIDRWENGTHEPYISELAPVIEYLGGDVSEAVALVVSETRETLQEAA